MTEIRTTSSTGGQKGVKAERHDLLPKAGLDAIARVFDFGAQKYADHNWRRGYEWGKSYAALQRHLTAFWDGETNDPESGLPHLGHAGFHVLVLLTWLAEQGEGAENLFDDRWPASMERAETAAEEEARLLAEQEAQDEAATVVWGIPETITLEKVETSLPAISLLTGIPESELSLMVESQQRKAEYAFPRRFIAGVHGEHVDPAPRVAHSHFTVAEDGIVTQNVEPIPTRPWNMTYEEWVEAKRDEAADVVTGHREALDRVFNPPVDRSFVDLPVEDLRM